MAKAHVDEYSFTHLFRCQCQFCYYKYWEVSLQICVCISSDHLYYTWIYCVLILWLLESVADHYYQLTLLQT